MCPRLHMCSIRAVSKAGGITWSSSAPVPAVSKCHNREPHACGSYARSPPQLNIALKKMKEYEKDSTFLTSYTTRKYTAQRRDVVRLEEHPDQVLIGNFPCLGLGLSMQPVFTLAAQPSLDNTGFPGCKQEQ